MSQTPDLGPMARIYSAALASQGRHVPPEQHVPTYGIFK